MVTQLNFMAPAVELKAIENLWFQLSNTACNLRCSHCFLDCSTDKKDKKFLSLDKIKNSLDIAKKNGLKEIYLTGGEPLLHPDLNTILRLGLKAANVTVLTNGTLLNDKKVRFLRQIENEHNNEIIFRVSIDHYTQEKNDVLRGRGVFRKTLTGIENLIRYGFNPILSIVNVWNEDEKSLKEGFAKLLKSIDFEVEEINFKIIPPIKTGAFSRNFSKYNENEIVTNEELKKNKAQKFDCKNSRIVANDGVYACPMLVNDHRGKVGTSLGDVSKSAFLETGICYTCVQQKKGLMNNNWET
ncbi:MAG: radical SAM protein [Candidatus Gastranaerophilales bacterium]|nr:radical SAM protein [Candidatus Gastranaerophilales bacterium]